MSFNIRVGGVNGNTTYDRITIGESQIFEIMPDSFGLQEASNIWMVALDERLTMYDWVGCEINTGGDVLKSGYANPIFYLKDKFQLLDSGNFWLSDTPDVPSVGADASMERLCTWAKLKNRLTGQVYVHVNTHFDHVSEEARVQAANLVSAYIEERFFDVPVVFTADLNTTDKGEAYATMTQNLTDTRLAAKDCVAYGTFHGGHDPNEKADYYIDFVLCSDDFSVEAYRTVTKGFSGRFTSDHFPIYADLKFAKKAVSPQEATVPFTDESDRAVWELPYKARELTQGLERTETAKVSQITGEDSPNRTLTRFNVWGTDLGSMTEMNGTVYMFCGDTFSSAENTDWRSNVLFTIEDDDPSDGLTITGTAADKQGRSKELLVNSHQVTVIPTNIFSVDDTLYCIFMHVTRWDDRGGVWDCNHSGLAKSVDEGKTWTRLNNVRWPGDSNFIQTANCLVGDTMYFWGIPAGRYGGVALMKCGVHELEDPEAYCYFTGCNENGEPLWIKGTSGIAQAKTVIPAPAGEISVLYNEYLGNFIITYLHEGKGLVMREGLTPWDGWSEEYLLASPSEYPALYGGYMCPKYTEENGRVFYFAMSQYLPVYNIMWMRAEMPEKQSAPF